MSTVSSMAICLNVYQYAAKLTQYDMRLIDLRRDGKKEHSDVVRLSGDRPFSLRTFTQMLNPLFSM